MLLKIYEFFRKYNDLRRLFMLRGLFHVATTSHELVRAYLRFNKRDIYFRRNTTDLECIKQVFLDQDYAVPFPLPAGAIIDGGSNIGSATLYFKTKYPHHFIVSVEPDLSNYEILSRNCEGLRDVVTIQAAIWPVNTRVSFEDPNSEKWSFSIADTPTSSGKIEAISIAEILSRYNIDRVSLLKLDIEGAERSLFSAPSLDWLDKVDILAIELHDRFKPGCAQALYAALYGREFHQEARGHTIFIRLNHCTHVLEKTAKSPRMEP